MSGREKDCAVARVLGDFFSPLFAFALQFLEVGNNRAQQLQNDRGADIGHDAQSEDRPAGKGTTHKHVVQPKKGVAGAFKVLFEHDQLDAGDRDLTADAIDDQKP